jgi:hypothetical protein
MLKKFYLNPYNLMSVILLAGLVQFPFARMMGGEPVKLRWNPVESVYHGEVEVQKILSFSGSVLNDRFGMLPLFVKTLSVDPLTDSVSSVTVVSPVYEQVPDTWKYLCRDFDKIPEEVLTWSEISVHRKSSVYRAFVLPFRINPENGSLECLVSFSLDIETVTRIDSPETHLAGRYASSSVLASGSWFKFCLSSNGVYRLGYEDLKAAGIDPAVINPKKIRIFGNGGGMLPEANAKSRIDDLIENPVFVFGEEDGRFDPGDYILFYGQSPDSWVFSKIDNLYHHIKNVYSEKTCYFLNYDTSDGLRIADESSSTLPATSVITQFDDYSFYEKDDINLIKSGREWWDKNLFDVTTSRNYSFTFPNIDSQKPATLMAYLAARSLSGSSSFTLSAQGSALATISIPATSGQYDDNYAREKTGTGTFTTANPVIDINLTYKKSGSSSIGYLNYLEINVTRKLVMAGAQMSFRSMSATSPSAVSEFTLSAPGQNIQVWDVTSPSNVKRIITTQTGSNHIFRLPTATLREFIAFDGSAFNTPVFSGKVENQDLHSIGSTDYIIITNPAFISEAGRLAEFHRQQGELSVFVTTTEKVFNEFSSGAQDITAIRDFIRMIYNRAEPGKEPKYLLLFGDASYDYKDRIQNNTNFVPSFQSVESLSPVYSFIADDYFGMLDVNEGQSATGNADIGIGRLPVSTIAEARAAVDKIIHYATNSEAVMDDWRNVITFVADDQNEGNNLFINDSESLARIIESKYKSYNVDKIYSDAYTMVSTPGGARYPEVNEVINKRVEKGCMIINYVGHGGEQGWAHERILEVPDIKAWRNYDRLPVFVTATCEFSRFDDPERVSAGEWVFLNSQGGGISLFTTTRLTFAGTNKSLLDQFYEHLFLKKDGKYPTMGDLIRESKDSMGNSSNIHSFVLLGDPAMRIAYPELNVVSTKVESDATVAAPDTLKALSVISVRGEVREPGGGIASGFNGTVYPIVFDKASEIWTKANYGYADPVKFSLRKNIVYKGKVEVKNGEFSFTFMVPKDIAYQYGIGKISYYAKSEEADGAGYDENIQVGGYNNSAPFDDLGPEISLFINDRNFVSGGITGPRPVLIADISDTSGINTVGNGIGHDITAILDNKTSYPMILNDYYVSDLNTYKSGVITYPLSSLADGEHLLTVKVWDVYNNSSEASISFIVVSSAEFALEHLYNFPNPMRDHTTFSWETNQVNEPLYVELKVYNLFGRLIKTISRQINPAGFRNVELEWDGTQDSGQKISSGTYVYQLSVKIPDGTVKRLSSKLVVIK